MKNMILECIEISSLNTDVNFLFKNSVISFYFAGLLYKWLVVKIISQYVYDFMLLESLYGDLRGRVG